MNWKDFFLKVRNKNLSKKKVENYQKYSINVQKFSIEYMLPALSSKAVEDYIENYIFKKVKYLKF